ncbi:MAG: polysaccharide biosynthesis C-terminal domain-containing protein [Alphaproteobacteria bacterium]|nr:polysaccharide biosynthesis C-terminal domain-containing protein [Alphaproteobacteria bacterium]
MVLSHALYYLVAAVLQAAAALGIVAALTRLLSDVEFGQYGLATAALHLYQSIAFFWLRANVSRFHAEAERAERLGSFLAAVRRCFLVVALAGGALSAAIVLVAPVSPGLRATLWATLGAATAQGAFTLVLELHRATLSAWRYALFQSIQAALGVGLSLAFVLGAGHFYGGMGAALAMAGLAVSFFLCMAIDSAGGRFWFGRGRAGPGEIRAFLVYGLPLAVVMVQDAFLATGDRFVIAHFLGEAGVGPYAAAVTLAHRSLLAICTVVGAAAAPLAFAALAEHGDEAARRRMGQSVDLLLATALPAAFGLAAVAGPISDVMVGEAMREEVRMLLPWIAAGALLHGLSVHYFHHAFLLSQRTMALFWAVSPVVLLYFALNAMLVPMHGAWGAALAMIATQALHLGLMVVVTRRVFPLPLRLPTLAKALAASALMYAALRLPGLPGGLLGLALQVALGALFYAAVALALDIAHCRDHAMRLLKRPT